MNLSLDVRLDETRVKSISVEFIYKTFFNKSFDTTKDNPHIAFIEGDDGFITAFACDEEPKYCLYIFENPFGIAGMPRGLKNTRIETGADFSDFCNQALEEFNYLEDQFEEAYDCISNLEKLEEEYDFEDSYADDDRGDDEEDD